MNKCKNCQWHNKPYWSIINPCDNCPNKNPISTTITIDQEKVFNEFVENVIDPIEQCQKLQKVVDELKRENKRLKKTIVIMEKYLELIHDLGYDYDGLNYEHDLKGLIDDMVRFASLGRACNTTEEIYVDGKGKSLNILGEELKESE